jgi:hypothetical protein
MEEKCGKKCFLGPYKSFPICDMNTCKVDKKGVWAAYIRAKEWATRSKTLKKKHASYHVRHPYSKIARSAKRMLYKNKGGLFGMFESKNPLIELHKSSSSFEQKDYETKVTAFINSILVNSGKDVYKVSDNVIEYFNTYKLSSDNCKSDDNQKILSTFNVIYKFVSILNEKTDNEKPDEKKYIINVFNATIKKRLEEVKDGLIPYNNDCMKQITVKEEKEEEIIESPKSESDNKQPKRRSLFGKQPDNRPRGNTV